MSKKKEESTYEALEGTWRMVQELADRGYVTPSEYHQGELDELVEFIFALNAAVSIARAACELRIDAIIAQEKNSKELKDKRAPRKQSARPGSQSGKEKRAPSKRRAPAQ